MSNESEKTASDDVDVQGRVLKGRYRLERVLGQGGTSRTWLAVDIALERELLDAPEPPEDLDGDGIPDAARVVAKELPLSRLREWKDLDLFEREAKMLGALDHEGIPSSRDHFLVEESQGPTFYLIQEWVDGDNLAERLRMEGTFDEAEARDLLEQLLPILNYLHTRTPALIHRDIKPSNIISRRGGRVALVDFGAVRSAANESGTTVSGTFGYMAPEQLQGRAVPASDIYALGATVCHLMSGRKPGDMAATHEAFGIDFRPWFEVSEGFAELLEEMLAPALSQRLESVSLVMRRLEALGRAGSGGAEAAAGGEPPGPDVALTSGPRSLTPADHAYAYLSLPSKLRTFAPLLAMLFIFVPPLALLVFFAGFYFSFKSLSEGYHNAQILGRGTFVAARVLSVTHDVRGQLQYTYNWNRQAYQVQIEVPRHLCRGLDKGSVITVCLDPYSPGDSVPLLGDAARRLK